jgi:hypothetical protein
MSGLPRPWLPAAAEREMEAALGDAAAAWLARWVVDPCPADPVEAISSAEGDGGVVLAEAPDLVALGAEACAGRADTDNPRDRRVLERVGQAMLDDLAADLAGQQREASSGATSRFKLSCATRGWSLRISLSPEDQVTLRKRGSSPARPVRLGSRGKALATESVWVGCHLGSAGLTAGEAKTLAPGDLIVLDRELAEAVPVTVAGVVCAGGTARIERSGAQLTLRLESAINLARN